MNLNVAFRVDASIDIGNGHVMRCLSLAAALSGAGARCTFLTRYHQGHLIQTIKAQGHRVMTLPKAERAAYGVHSNPPPHADWLAGGWREDASASRDILNVIEPDWLIVDHYALDACWERLVAPPRCKLAVIDDLADRPHAAELLLDQNIGRVAKDYQGLVPNICSLLIGPEFALLRPEFAAARQRALARDAFIRPRHLLISLGGIDKKNTTGKLLAMINRLDIPTPPEIRAICGPNAPHLDAVIEQARQMRITTKVLVGVDDMAEQMLWADFAIGAAGTSTWERCCMALPTLVVALAENQEIVAQRLDDMGISRYLGDHNSDICEESLSSALLGADLPRQLLLMRSASAALCDGHGCERVVKRLIERGH